MECFRRVQAKNQPRRAETLTSELRVAENVVMSLCRRSSVERHAGRVRAKLCDTQSLISYTTITRIKITVVPGYMASRDVRELENSGYPILISGSSCSLSGSGFWKFEEPYIGIKFVEHDR